MIKFFPNFCQNKPNTGDYPRKCYGLDEIDRRILTRAQENAYESVEKLGDAIGLSRNACWSRLKRLQEESCPSPLELCHYIGRERGIGHCEEATF
ncbi:AsnC family protein, partial [uncultured Tateyamaria sp.]|uniref:AsnC family protein n=1 Tax=uncultured Tateyamaria sp. TaxID=455651 RepID=UPI002612ECB1